MTLAEIFSDITTLYATGGSNAMAFLARPLGEITLVLGLESVLRIGVLTLIAGGLVSLAKKYQPRGVAILATDKPPIIQRRIERWSYPANVLAFGLLTALTAWVFVRYGWVTFWDGAGATRWIALETLALLILHDAYFYWVHRLMHLPSIYAATHRLHHASVRPTVWTSYNFAPLETLGEFAFVPLVLAIAGATIGGIHAATLLVFGTIYVVMNLYHHSGVEILPAWWTTSPWTKWISTSTFHFLHHSENRGNFGFYFNVWDRVCGTLTENYDWRFREISTPK